MKMDEVSASGVPQRSVLGPYVLCVCVFLGFLIDSILSWKPHIKVKCPKVSQFSYRNEDSQGNHHFLYIILHILIISQNNSFHGYFSMVDPSY